MNHIYLSLGSNIGDRLAFLQQAQEQLEGQSEIQIIRYSPIYKTENWPRSEGKKEKNDWHLNQMVCLQTNLSANELFLRIQEIEKTISQKKREHWGPREIDIDLLLYGEETLNSEDLKIPHPQMNERQFVLIPLLDIAPDLTDPVSKQPYSDILRALKEKDDHKVTRFL